MIIMDIDNIKEENWKDIEGYEGKYQISDGGRVKNAETGKVLKQKCSNEFYYCELYTKGFNKRNTKKHRIHRLVAEHFVGNPFKKKYVQHIDKDKSNNKYNNLIWKNTYDDSSEIYKEKDDSQTIEKIKKEPITIERWLNIKSYENTYKISNFGKVMNKLTNLLLNPYYLSGYMAVELSGKSYLIHRLVALHFIDNPDKKTWVDHIDNTPTNNREDNLRWITPSENSLAYHTNYSTRSKNPILQYDMDGCFIKEWNCVSELLKEHKTYRGSQIYNALNGKYSSAYGYVWEYKINKPQTTDKIDTCDIFKNIGNFNNHDFSKYECSNNGKVKSLHMNIILKPAINKGGYKYYSLVDNNIRKDKNNMKSFTILEHILVAHLFVDGMSQTNNFVNHLDKNRQNNNYINLEWTTQRLNNEHASGRKIVKLNMKTSKEIEIYNSLISAAETIKENVTVRSIARNISYNCQNKTDSAYGYKWKFKDE